MKADVMRRSRNIGLKSEFVRSVPMSRTVLIDGAPETIRLNEETWANLADIAGRESMSRDRICGLVRERLQPGHSMESAIRVFVLAYYRAAAQPYLNARGAAAGRQA